MINFMLMPVLFVDFFKIGFLFTFCNLVGDMVYGWYNEF